MDFQADRRNMTHFISLCTNHGYMCKLFRIGQMARAQRSFTVCVFLNSIVSRKYLIFRVKSYPLSSVCSVTFATPNYLKNGSVCYMQMAAGT